MSQVIKFEPTAILTTGPDSCVQICLGKQVKHIKQNILVLFQATFATTFGSLNRPVTNIHSCLDGVAFSDREAFDQTFDHLNSEC